ncbi:MAG TPA: ABC-type transport auxiliary lipoprotein family protein, partial [Opitutaceae bacterium]|nr:ABC-type transport auxiliary lipoprotein family protein [Opitutaceae bacterium]
MIKNATPCFLSAGSLVLRSLGVGGWLLPSVLWFFTTGCSLPEARLDTAHNYVLRVTAEAVPPKSSGLHVGLFPVQLPEYLKQRAMVVREGASEVRYNDEERWAESLDAGLTRVLRERLSATAQVLAYPFTTEQARDYDVRVRVQSCEGTS